MLTRDIYSEPRDFMEDYLSQLTPRVVRNVYTMNELPPHILTPRDIQNMRKDYNDVITHPPETLLDIFGPLLKR